MVFKKDVILTFNKQNKDEVNVPTYLIFKVGCSNSITIWGAEVICCLSTRVDVTKTFAWFGQPFLCLTKKQSKKG